jgi:hypothetical protein
MQIALIDAIGPFFRGYARRRINWSKIPFGHLATDGDEADAQWRAITADLELFARKVRATGYTAVSLDDLAHVTDHPWHDSQTRHRIQGLRERFRPLVALLRAAQLDVYFTADFVVTSPTVDARLGGHAGKAAAWFKELAAAFLDDFPEVAGIILRIGESDGVDVRDELRSRLILRTDREVNAMLRDVLPVFEQRKRRLIFRTWTVGAYLVGDLIWHRGRLARALQAIQSPSLVISMKYGESDFFRYLPLNRHFFRIDTPKMIEFQARREYEGAGEYPAFIGWDVEHYARELASAQGMIGFSVWCQTGGWHAFRRRAFLDPAAVWIDLNAAVAVRILRDRATVEEAVAAFFPEEKSAAALELLRRSEIVIRELLYIEEFASQKLFFRRVRIPPLLHAYWDSLFINDAVRKILAHFVHDPEQAIRQGEAAFSHFARMEQLAAELGLPIEDIHFMRDSFELILLARRYYLVPAEPGIEERIRAAKRAYKERWPRNIRQRYRIRLSFAPGRLTGETISWLLRLLVRRQRGYRTVLDRLFTLRALSWFYRLFRVRHREALPKFLRKSAMGVDSLFR